MEHTQKQINPRATAIATGAKKQNRCYYASSYDQQQVVEASYA